MRKRHSFEILLCSAAAISSVAAADNCANRAALDALYCDADRNLIAEGSGEAFNRAAYEKESKREDEARGKAAEENTKKQ
jgi:hypothetical protein